MSTLRRMLRRDLVADAGIAAAVLAFSLAALSHGSFDPGRSLDVLGVVLATLASVPLAARRSAPLQVFALVTGATAALYGLRYGLGPPVGFAIALYTVTERRNEIRPRTWTVALVGSVVLLLGPHLVRDGFAPELLLGGAVWAAAWFAGDRTRLRRERMAELEERALRAEREAERERRLAAAEERARIARDLHDSAGHAINVILVQAGAARLLSENDPDGARAALRTIEDVARDTVDEIESLVRVLREDEDSRDVVEPPAGLAALETLAERHRAAGGDLDIRIRGSRRPLPSAIDQAAYRILQEALTNAARHGNGTAEVDVAYTPGALELTVTNPAPGESNSVGGGHGIVGMRERAALLGGTVDAGADNGVFRVEARLPLEREPA
jgi:signal transduction histidine kinase